MKNKSKNKKPEYPIFNEEEGFLDDGLLPDGSERMPITKQDKRMYDSLQSFFDGAWIHGF